ncbi:class I SAM-dependent RNA methyltransferase [Egicoccus halophilus]|uniref:23S rRNA methyltransferase n=1 Tax=Egicoccus halophilus TaxID=1670830 RepID=A0A8J3ABH6_9ACTN|nr:TRAM domain-containing protein [Egicoccus halophilus]GGI07640.1 23S rRNA methyltransferase [Egicoccus halophilus]
MSRAKRVPLPREVQTVAVDGFTHGGEGVARLEGKAVFVPGALPGETVALRVVDDRKRWARAELVEVVTPGPGRASADHPQRHRCGGCDLEHVTPAGQLRLKTRVVREQLERLGSMSEPPVADAREVGPATGYRNRARFHVAPDTGRLGFFLPGSHDLLPAEGCTALSPDVVEIAHAVAPTSAAEVTVRAHGATRAVVLTPGPGGLDLPDGDFSLLLEQPDGAVVTMRGDGVLTEAVAGHRFRFDATSFFQNNSAGAAALVDTVVDAVAPVDAPLVWDLYAGVGLLSLPLAAAGAEVVAVEGHESAAEWSRRNAADAGQALTVVHEPVHRFLRAARRGEGPSDPPDVVVLDPPRTGAGEDVVDALVAAAPATIVYVACDPAALARDARALVAGGYRLERAVPLDLFPMTHHVETVATFTR